MRKLLPLFALGLLVIGCSNKSNSNATALQGSWTSLDCLTDVAGSRREVFEFDGNNFHVFDRVFTSGNCSGASTIDEAGTGTFSLMGPDTRSGATPGTQLINFVQGNVSSFDIFLLNGNSLKFGTPDSSTNEASRPAALSTLVYTRQ